MENCGEEKIKTTVDNIFRGEINITESSIRNKKEKFKAIEESDVYAAIIDERFISNPAAWEETGIDWNKLMPLFAIRAAVLTAKIFGVEIIFEKEAPDIHQLPMGLEDRAKAAETTEFEVLE